MKKLLMLTAAAGFIFALAEPTLAAQRTHRAFDAYASGERSGAYNYGPVNGGAVYDYAPSVGGPVVNGPANTPAQHIYSSTPYGGQNLPYPDRPYGAPDSW
jgi:hypothetical protein